MRLLNTPLAAFAVTSFAGLAEAQDLNQDQNQDSGVYAGIGVAAYVTEPIGAAGTDLYAVEAKVGYNFNKFFGVEAQGSIGLNTVSDPFADGSLNRKIDYSVGAFAVGRLPVSEKFELFARAGVHNTQLGREVENPPLIDGVPFTAVSLSETGFAGGLGAQYNFDKKNAIRADYTYFDRTNAETLSLGYIRKF